MITKAAGILFLTKDNKALFLLRGLLGDHAGEWCFPGGRIEGDETPEEAAVREALEEVVNVPDGTRSPLSRSISEVASVPPGVAPAGEVQAISPQVASPADPDFVDFTTFLQRVDAEFVPQLNEEHVGFCWAPVSQMPGPIHPGCSVAVEMLSADELDIARLMAAGRITSPQVYKNVTLWAMRITGTGVSHRPKIDEFVFRDPALYLNDEFLARCNGLAVQMYHPEKATLDHTSYKTQNIGSIMLPYIKGNEVWGIAKVYDAEANATMTVEQMSTSPGVVLAHPDSPSYKLRMEGGEKILIEGKPSLLDHVAVCGLGVWDKGGDAAGIILNDSTIINDSTGDKSIMDDKEKNELKDSIKNEVMDAIRKDSAERAEKTDATLDKLLKGIDSVCGQMDSFGKRMDAVEEDKKKVDAAKVDSAKKDAEEEEKKKVDAWKADNAKNDGESEEDYEKRAKDDSKKDAHADSIGRALSKALGPIADRIAAVEKGLPKALSDGDRQVLSSTQAQFDSVFHAFNDQAPRFMDGESVTDYRIRMLTKLKENSPTWKPANLSLIAADSAALDAAQATIFADSMVAARTPPDVEEGALRMIKGRTESGHQMNTFVGKDATPFIRKFSPPRRAIPNMVDVLQKRSAKTSVN